MIHLYYLPEYSLEYNPVERIWGWLKPKIYGFAAIGGVTELIERFKKLIWHFNEGILPNPIEMKLKNYQVLL